MNVETTANFRFRPKAASYMARARLAAIPIYREQKMAKRDRYQLEIKQERIAKRAKMFQKAAIIARIETTHDSTDLSDDDLFLEIYEALVVAGLGVHETDTNRYLGIQKKVELSKQQEAV